MRFVGRFFLIVFLAAASLVLAEGLTMVGLSLVIKQDRGWAAAASLIVLPLWAAIFSSAYFVKRKLIHGAVWLLVGGAGFWLAAVINN